MATKQVEVTLTLAFTVEVPAHWDNIPERLAEGMGFRVYANNEQIEIQGSVSEEWDVDAKERD